jgi:hypothetical protein
LRITKYTKRKRENNIPKSAKAIYRKHRRDPYLTEKTSTDLGNKK